MNIIQEIFKIQKEGVEWKSLGEICEIKTGKGITKKDMSENAEYSIISGGVNPMGKYKYFNTKEDTLTIARAGSAGFVNFIVEKFWLNDKCFSIIPKIEFLEKISEKFLYYFCKNIEEDIMGLKSEGTVPTVTIGKLQTIQIPIPPPHIQEEIVKILDTFTELEAELEAELEKRKKQYDYYLNDLLTPKNSVIWEEKTLGTIAELKYGFTDKAKDFGNIRFLRITDIGENGHLKMEDAKFLEKNLENTRYLVEKGDLLMARTGATYGKTLFYNQDEPAVFASFLIKIIINKSIMLPKFYWHFSQSSLYWDQANKLVTKGGQPQFNANVLKEIKISYPQDLKIQQKIVDVLDNFEKICNDLNIGLPAEIEARQKQYEYYREKLLTFNPLEGLNTHTHTTIGLIKILWYVYGYVKISLGEIGEFIRGNGLQKTDFREEGKPCIHYGQIYTFYGIRTKKTKTFCEEEIFKKLKKAKAGDLLIATTSENIEDLGKCVLWEGDGEVGISGHSCIFQTKQDAGFIGYYLRSKLFEDFKSNNVYGVKVKELYIGKLEQFSIYLPSPTKQKEIVSILNQFDTLINSLSDGLPAEIEKRQKQYEYYRNLLLNFNEK